MTNNVKGSFILLLEIAALILIFIWYGYKANIIAILFVASFNFVATKIISKK